MGASELLWIAAGLALLGGLAAAAALLLRLIGVPGGRPAAAVGGGLIAGVLLGPCVAGAAWPDWWRGIFTGGEHERGVIAAVEGRHERERDALTATGVTPAALDDLAAQQATEIAARRKAHDDALARTRLVYGWGVTAVLAAALACAAWGGSRSSREPRPGEAMAMTAAACVSVAFAMLPTTILLSWMLGVPVSVGLPIGAAVAAGSAFGGLPTRWTPEHGRRPAVRAMALAGLVVSAAAVAWAVPPERSVWLLLPGVGFGAGLLFAALFPPGPRGRGAARAVVLWIGVPLAAAHVARHIDWSAIAATWWAIGFVAFAAFSAGDGHFIGAWLGIKTFAAGEDRAAAELLSVEYVASGVGMTQVCLGVVLLTGGVLDPAMSGGAAALAGLMANAFLIELMAHANRRVLRLAHRPEPG